MPVDNNNNDLSVETEAALLVATKKVYHRKFITTLTGAIIEIKDARVQEYWFSEDSTAVWKVGNAADDWKTESWVAEIEAQFIKPLSKLDNSWWPSSPYQNLSVELSSLIDDYKNAMEQKSLESLTTSLNALTASCSTHLEKHEVASSQYQERAGSFFGRMLNAITNLFNGSFFSSLTSNIHNKIKTMTQTFCTSNETVHTAGADKSEQAIAKAQAILTEKNEIYQACEAHLNIQPDALAKLPEKVQRSNSTTETTPPTTQQIVQIAEQTMRPQWKNEDAYQLTQRIIDAQFNRKPGSSIEIHVTCVITQLKLDQELKDEYAQTQSKDNPEYAQCLLTTYLNNGKHKNDTTAAANDLQNLLNNEKYDDYNNQLVIYLNTLKSRGIGRGNTGLFNNVLSKLQPINASYDNSTSPFATTDLTQQVEQLKIFADEMRKLDLTAGDFEGNLAQLAKKSQLIEKEVQQEQPEAKTLHSAGLRQRQTNHDANNDKQTVTNKQSSLFSATGDATNQLSQRGEKINTITNKTEKMEAAAEEFARQTALLLKQQEKGRKWF